MARKRCSSILRHLHFVNNKAPRARDKLWKLRPVVEVLQKRFLFGWSLPSTFSFDEGVLPAKSKWNTTRVFVSDKPHRYGSKMFMVCDSISAYYQPCHLKGGGNVSFKCPKLVTEYQYWMGGVDVHDQLRLQWYSIQTSFRFQKYYKSLFVGVVDMALENAYTTYKQTCTIKRRVPKHRVDW
ncbi:hypothetical protein PC129_g22263 [Phytophthora cactorum]|uniref:PiggyBac transposable element-derived protein domain-containing protein n=1 Tax=Phytophthora cactorum TaxID=29920 RepID=A0A329RR11_9STRA|nr:hypothetical protein Pcac1_g4842 [Phytophthora cactorum]KAG2829316.1 hypothetical protein PC113_g21300 [Phytophthora cactorum]KAG2838693.1 hypothetical protein PC112_g4397 [Phytophthora cactorum]KAG2841274.1 hypothetical protein PC111_g3177 [Phytophthora cactorum]KAG2905105.1 hypothetical protein PC117_g20839 [Phytophthora cactorum]